MTDSFGAHLPAEILHAILVRLHDGGFYYTPKHGLAACSLACRHWAGIIRPMLFDRLTLRSAEDVAQLLVLLRAPAILGQPLQTLIHAVDIEEDQARDGVPWGHRFLHRLGPYLPTKYEMYFTWAIRGAPAADTIRHLRTLGQKWPPFVLLPRAPPVRRLSANFVTLSNLRLQSARVLSSFVKQLRYIDELLLENVSFAKDTPALALHLPHALRCRSGYSYVRAYKSITSVQSVPFWVALCSALLAAQRTPFVDDATLALVVGCLESLASFHVLDGVELELTATYVAMQHVDHGSARPVHGLCMLGCRTFASWKSRHLEVPTSAFL